MYGLWAGRNGEEGDIMNKVIGKIESARFGYWEYVFGLHLTIKTETGGVTTSEGYNPTYKYTVEAEAAGLKMLARVQKLLKDANVESIHQLKDVPLEVTFDGSLLREFRILKEVL